MATTTIMPQKMVNFRSDDWGFFYRWNDSCHVEAFDNIQSVEAEFPQYDVKHTFACWTDDFTNDKKTVNRLRQAQQNGDELTFHLGILGDTATYSETMQAIQADVNKRQECNLEPAETSIANGGLYGNESTQAYKDYGTWVNEGTASYHPRIGISIDIINQFFGTIHRNKVPRLQKMPTTFTTEAEQCMLCKASKRHTLLST